MLAQMASAVCSEHMSPSRPSPLPPLAHTTPFQADKLLSPEFQPVVEQLINFLSQNRQICLYRWVCVGGWGA